VARQVGRGTAESHPTRRASVNTSPTQPLDELGRSQATYVRKGRLCGSGAAGHGPLYCLTPIDTEPLKSRPKAVDAQPVGISPDSGASATPESPTPATKPATNDEASYTSLSDLELILERDRLREQLDDLTDNPGSSPVVSHLLVNIDEQIDRMTEELTRRALSRHPSSSGPNSRQRYRSLLR
jgi:hypothetical protein